MPLNIQTKPEDIKILLTCVMCITIIASDGEAPFPDFCGMWCYPLVTTTSGSTLTRNRSIRYNLFGSNRTVSELLILDGNT